MNAQRLSSILFCACMLPSVPAWASTLAYYRYEDQSSGYILGGANGNQGPYATNIDSYSDAGVSQGANGAQLLTYNSGDSNTAGAYYSDGGTSPQFVSTTPNATVPGNGLTNTTAARFGANTDGNYENRDIYGINGTGPLSTFQGNSLTFETYALFSNITPGGNNIQTIVVRDKFNGNDNGQAEPNFELRVEGNGALVGVASSRTGGARDGGPEFLGSAANSIVANTWYHLAFVIDGTNSTASLYINGNQVATETLANGLREDPNNNAFALGRGFYNGNATDWLGKNGTNYALLDETRFSDTALSPSQFLNAVPEPASLSALGLAAAGILRRRRKA